jgi:uncharacterized protein YecE (DUF72 family)
MAPLANRIGQYWLQLPATFARATCLRSGSSWMPCPGNLPTAWKFGILNFCERRSGKSAQRGLLERSVNRVILDSRPVHSAIPHNEAIVEAQRKKPKVPVHAIVTAHNPMVRFIGSDNMQQNQAMFAVWLQKLASWEHTTTPYLFLHTPDIAQAPNWSMLCGRPCRLRCRPWAAPLPSHNNLLFSDITPIIGKCHLPKTGSLYGQRAVCGVRCITAD